MIKYSLYWINGLAIICMLISICILVFSFVHWELQYQWAFETYKAWNISNAKIRIILLVYSFFIAILTTIDNDSGDHII